MSSWIYLLGAILSEVIGTVSIRLLMTSSPVYGYMFMYFMIMLSYLLLARAIKRIPLGVAYALWEGVGIVLITASSAVLFREYVSSCKALGLGIMISGIFFLKSGSRRVEAR